MSDDSFDINEFMKVPEKPVVHVAELDVQATGLIIRAV